MRKTNLITKISTLAAAVAMTVGANNAFAATTTLTADATIFNEVEVNYQTLSGADKIARADVSIKVRLVEALPTIKSTAQELDASDGEISIDYSVTSNANGIDTYSIIPTNDSAATETLFLTDPNGENPGVWPGSVDLGSGIVVAVDSDGISFPGGSSYGLEEGDYITIGNTTYIVGTILQTGQPKTHNQEEVYAKIQLKSLIGDVINPSNPIIVSVGDLVSETVYVKSVIEYSNDTSSNVSVTVGLGVTSDDSDGTANDNADTSTDGEAGNDFGPVVFEPALITVQKLVKVDMADAYSNAPTKKVFPGEELYYQLIVTPAGSDTKSVVLTDTLPAYTTYKADSTLVNFNGVETALDDDDDDSVNVVQLADKFDGEVTASGLTIRLGTGVTDALGGSLTSTDTISITYTVIVD